MKKLVDTEIQTTGEPQKIRSSRAARYKTEWQPSLGHNLRLNRERLGLQQLDVAAHLHERVRIASCSKLSGTIVGSASACT